MVGMLSLWKDWPWWFCVCSEVVFQYRDNVTSNINLYFVLIYNTYYMVPSYNGKTKKIIKGQMSDMTKKIGSFSCSYKTFKFLITCSFCEIKYKSVLLRNQFWNIFLRYCWVPFVMLLTTGTCLQKSVCHTAESWWVLYTGKIALVSHNSSVLSNSG